MCARPLESKPGCVAEAMCVIGSKWTSLILRYLATEPKRFSELEKLVAGINPRTLSRRLDDLEQSGILKKAKPAQGAYATYVLTPKGKDLTPILRKMAAWGNKYSQSAASRAS